MSDYNEKAYALGSKRSIIREIFEYAKERSAVVGKENVYDFSLGNPSVKPPEEVTETIERLLKEENSVSLHGYTSAQGDIGVRKAVANKIKTDFGVEKMSPDLVYMTCGAAASLTVSLHAVISEKGEECLVFAPFFTEYRVFAENAGATLVVSAPDQKTLGIDFDDLAEKITDKTKAVIVNSPNNPSGVVYGEETVKRLCDFLSDKEKEYSHPIYLIADEPYRELVYGDVKVPYFMNYYKNTLVCYSYSKALSLPGERIGYIAVNPEMQNVKSVYAAICGAGRALGYVCAPSLFQKVIEKCVNSKVNIDAYKENRDLLYKNLTEYGYDCVRPEGAFYMFVKSPEGDAFGFYEKAKKKDLLFVPCDDFGVKGFVRIAYCVDNSTVKNSLPAFKSLAEEYGLITPVK